MFRLRRTHVILRSVVIVFLMLWNYIRGYVAIEVSGFSVERFMNLAVHKGVYIWDVDKSSAAVSMKVSVKGFRMLRSCAKKTKCKISVVQKTGIPFLAFRYRRRGIYVFGIFFFIFILYFLSSFVWLIEIQGNDRINKEDIENFCRTEGLKVGGLKSSFDTLELQKKLAVEFPDISWVNVNVKGTKATIKLTEIIPKKEILDVSVPCDIIASKDGLITNIITSSGTPKVKQNDVVKKGDILVSSELIITEDETGVVKEYVHAIAEVRAKMYYELNFSVPLSYTEKIYTGDTKKNRFVILFNKNFNFLNSNIFYVNYDKITSRNQITLAENYPLPIIFVTEEYREFRTEERVRTIEQAKELADKMVTGRILREFDFESDIVDKQLIYTENEHEIYVHALITTIERIDEKREIEIDPISTYEGRDTEDVTTEDGNANS